MEGSATEDALSRGNCDTVSCLVAHSDRPGFLLAHPVQLIHQNALSEVQAKGKVPFRNMACDSC